MEFLHEINGGGGVEEEAYGSPFHVVLFITPKTYFTFSWDRYYFRKPLGDNVHPKWGSKSRVSFMFQADVPVIFSQSKSTSCTHVD